MAKTSNDYDFLTDDDEQQRLNRSLKLSKAVAQIGDCCFVVAFGRHCAIWGLG